MPTFGQTVMGPTWISPGTSIVGGKWTCPLGGTAQSITVWIKALWDPGEKVKCAIYDAGRNYIATTEERNAGLVNEAWNTFNFPDPKPALVAATDYILCQWRDTAHQIRVFANVAPNSFWVEVHAYDGWPATLAAPTTPHEPCIYCTYLTNTVPTAPTGLEVGGKSSPTGSNCNSDLAPGFTAIYNDPDAGDQANAIEIQVGTAAGLSDMWTSGWLADNTIEGNRCTAKTYAGATLSGGTSYWWRCRFRDDGDAVGAWSAWQQFDICALPPNAPLDLLCNDLVNPKNVRPPIYFSAIFDNPELTRKATHCQIQVSLQENFSDLIWDSLRRKIVNIDVGMRSQNIFYAGPDLPLDRRKYYWRLKFWNDAALAGPWSS